MYDHDHDHSHDRDHELHHEHARHGHRETYADKPHSQHVVLELGDGVGALIVHTDPRMLGTEVEISPAGQDGRRSHKEVLERTTNGASAYVLVFDGLAEGEYTLWIDDVAAGRNVRVNGGAVAEIDWRREPSPGETTVPGRDRASV
jgi:hypothetical protein